MRFSLVMLVLFAFLPEARATEWELKGPDGVKLARVIDCNSCSTPGGSGCEAGVEDGFAEGQRCGKCLLDANFGQGVPSTSDIQLTGYLKDETGAPLSGKFIRVFLPNTWSVRTRSNSDGFFTARLGATREPKNSTPATLQVGDLTLKKTSKLPYYALYMLPVQSAPCGSTTAQNEALKPKK